MTTPTGAVTFLEASSWCCLVTKTMALSC
jgi:hypothetical protein